MRANTSKRALLPDARSAKQSNQGEQAARPGPAGRPRRRAPARLAYALASVARLASRKESHQATSLSTCRVCGRGAITSRRGRNPAFAGPLAVPPRGAQHTWGRSAGVALYMQALQARSAPVPAPIA